MSDLLPPALALNPEESLHEELLPIKKQLDDLHRRVGTSLFIDKILPKLLPGLHFSHGQRGYHKKQTTISDLVPALSVVLKEKSLVDAKEELADLYKRVDTANSIEIVHGAKNTEDNTVVYASGTFKDGRIIDYQGESHCIVPLDNNEGPTTCKLKDLRECRICVGGGFMNFTKENMKRVEYYNPKHPLNDGKIEYSLIYDSPNPKYYDYRIPKVKFTIHGWPEEEHESLFHNLMFQGLVWLDDFFRVTATVAPKYPEATVRFTLASFKASAIKGPLREGKGIEKLTPCLYTRDFSTDQIRSSLSQTKQPSQQTTKSDLLPEKTLLDTKKELDGLYRRLETATSIQVVQENICSHIVVCASGKIEDGNSDDYNAGVWYVPLNNDKMPTCKLHDLWKCCLCVGGGFKYQNFIAENSTGSLHRSEDGRIECSIYFSDPSLEVTMTIYGWPIAEGTSTLGWALAPGLGGGMGRIDDAIDFFYTVADDYPEATVRFDLVSFHAKTITRLLTRLLPKHRRKQLKL